jgi:hypothetical protein
MRERIQENLPAVCFEGILVKLSVTPKSSVVDKNPHRPVPCLHLREQSLRRVRPGEIDRNDLGLHFEF